MEQGSDPPMNNGGWLPVCCQCVFARNILMAIRITIKESEDFEILSCTLIYQKGRLITQPVNAKNMRKFRVCVEKLSPISRKYGMECITDGITAYALLILIIVKQIQIKTTWPPLTGLIRMYSQSQIFTIDGMRFPEGI